MTADKLHLADGEEETRQIGIHISADLYERVQAQAAQQHRSMSGHIRHLLERGWAEAATYGPTPTPTQPQPQPEEE